MRQAKERKLRIVSRLDEERQPLLEERSVDELLGVLRRRAHRMVEDPGLCERLFPVIREFVCNIVEYYAAAGELDEYLLTNILTALATADAHGSGPDGPVDFSTFIRRPTPTAPDTYECFVIGRDGRADDAGCPLGHGAGRAVAMSEIPAPQLHMYLAFYHARTKDSARGAPKLPTEDMRRLIPDEIGTDPDLEAAFLDVCFSDGAWELYQLKLAA